MHFSKMHGLGNDFVVVAQETVPQEASMLAKAICDRHFGVGADGLVFLTLSDRADVAMRIFNADGSEAEQCGNAVRCVAKYFYERITDQKTELLVETKSGIQPISLAVEQGRVEQVCVDMGVPILEPATIPIQTDQIVDYPIQVFDQSLQFTAVSMGNPHMVIEVKELSQIPIEQWGPILEHHPLFPNKTNVEFIQMHNPREISMRVWERSVGETMACGSGACAALVAQVLRGKAEREAVLHLQGGELDISWNSEDQHVYMTGPAAMVFEGHWS